MAHDNATILVIEDEPEIAELLATHIRHAGYFVRVIDRGLTGLTSAQQATGTNSTPRDSSQPGWGVLPPALKATCHPGCAAMICLILTPTVRPPGRASCIHPGSPGVTDEGPTPLRIGPPKSRRRRKARRGS